MKTYRFAIDETGSFTMAEKDKSFVCGVLISNNEFEIKKKYQEAYWKISSCEKNQVPNDTKGLIGTEVFHFSKQNESITDREKRNNTCRELLLPLVDEIYISKNKPTLFANNQSWWLVALTSVILEFLKRTKFEQNDKVEILIDNRAEKTFGLTNGATDFKEYHNLLKEQIKGFTVEIAKARKIDVEIIFSSDTRSLFINLADIACGFVRTERKSILRPITECDCRKFRDGSDPIELVSNNPMAALAAIFQEITNNEFENLKLVNKKFLSKFRNNPENYVFVWDMFYDLIKFKISERARDSNLVNIKTLVCTFLNEFEWASKNEFLGSEKLEIMILFVEYFSHIGDIQSPFDKESVLNALKGDSETRLMRKWEKYVSYSLREVQILFNGYKFSESVDTFEDIWNKQEQIINNMPDLVLSNEMKKDEPTTAIIGSLAQSYAYNGELDKAVEYFEISKDYSIKTTHRTDSSLFTIYHRKNDIEKTRHYFEKQTGLNPEEYARNENYEDNWKLLSYCKLRALELYKNNQTDLPAVDLKKLNSYNSEYPFPLIQKWEGIAKWLESPNMNRNIVTDYFTDAINILLKEDNGFAMRTLALPIIQCFALVDNTNSYHAKYNTILAGLKQESKDFSSFVDKRADVLNNIKNNGSIWERAMLLPFIYA